MMVAKIRLDPEDHETLREMARASHRREVDLAKDLLLKWSATAQKPVALEGLWDGTRYNPRLLKMTRELMQLDSEYAAMHFTSVSLFKNIGGVAMRMAAARSEIKTLDQLSGKHRLEPVMARIPDFDALCDRYMFHGKPGERKERESFLDPNVRLAPIWTTQPGHRKRSRRRR